MTAFELRPLTRMGENAWKLIVYCLFVCLFVWVLSFLTELKLSNMWDDVPLGDSQFRTLPTAILLARLRLSWGSVEHTDRYQIPQPVRWCLKHHPDTTRTDRYEPGFFARRELRQVARHLKRQTLEAYNVMASKRAVCKTRITQISAQQLYPFALEPEHPKAFWEWGLRKKSKAQRNFIRKH